MGYFFINMGDLRRILNNMERLDQTKILVAVLRRPEVKNFIIELNTEKQLAFGLDSKGEPVGFYKSFAYASQKKRKGGKAPFGTIDLKVTGDYYKTFMVDILTGGDLIIDSDTQKPDRDLRDIQGITKDIEGLTEESLDSLVIFMIPFFVVELDSEIFK